MSQLDGSEIAQLLSQARQRDDEAVGELLRVYQSYVLLLAQVASCEAKSRPPTLHRKRCSRRSGVFHSFKERRSANSWCG